MELSESWKGGQTRHILVDPTDHHCFDMALQWLENCAQKHPICNAFKRDTFTPTRLVDVGPETNTGIHICEQGNTQPLDQERYVALSHCWGLSQHLVSIHSNINDWKENIPWDRLPRTFQEAISVTRRLGLRYIWIDSLCIIQDDAKDWDKEAAKMGMIYNQAYLVIAATSSIDGDGGILFDRLPYVTINGRDQDQNPFQVFARKPCQHGPFTWGIPQSHARRATRYGSGYSTDPGYPLLTRAWCYQERLLGRRILHFTKDEMVFECLSSVNCECGAMTEFKDEWLLPARQMVSSERHIGISDLSLDRSSVLGKLPELILTREDSKDYDVFAEWRDMVSEYSQKNITHKSDWLPALGGIASKWVSPITGDYLAGLWSRDLLRGLLWQPTSPDRTEKPSYIAPSWSWTSIQHPVKWIHGNNTEKFLVEIDLERTSCIAKGVNKFGEVTAGWLFMTGSIAECTLDELSDNGTRGLLKIGLDSQLGFSLDSFWRCEQYLGKKVYCLKYCTDLITKFQSGVHRALILAPVEEDDEDFSRIPDSIREYSPFCRRIGSLGHVEPDSWGLLDNVSTVRSFCLI